MIMENSDRRVGRMPECDIMQGTGAFGKSPGTRSIMVPAPPSVCVDFHLQQRRAQGLAVSVERQRGGDAARQRVAPDELQRVKVRQLEARQLPFYDRSEVALDRLDGHAL